MTRLLVSVRSAPEATAALRGGADLIDVKEPRHGSLGAAEARVWQEVAQEMGGEVPLSAALGELAEATPDICANLASVEPAFQFAKFGFSNCAEHADWQAKWEQLIAQLPSTVAPVAVIYADWKLAGAPQPLDILAAAREHSPVVLIDTFTKDGRGLLDFLPLSRLEPLVQQIHQSGLRVVLAGSLTRRVIQELLPLHPDYVAVRGAVCAGNRRGALQESRVRELTDLLRSSPQRQNAVPSPIAIARNA